MGDDYPERQASAGGQQVNAQRHPKIVGIEEVGLGTFFLLLLFLLLNESNGASSVVTLALMLAIVGATFILLGFMTLWRTTDSIQKRSAPEAQQGGFPAPMNATEPIQTLERIYTQERQLKSGQLNPALPIMVLP